MPADNLAKIIEPPFETSGISASVAANPNAADGLLQLLQRLDGLSVRDALVEESLAYGRLQGGPEHAVWLANRTRTGMQSEGCVDVQRRDSVLDITLNRPWAHNAIDRAMRDDLREAFTLAALDTDIAHVRLAGVGKAFCVGAELNEFGTTRDPEVAHAIRLETSPAFAIIDCADRLEVHIQGACVGAGLEMAAFARRITAHANAWFQLPELAMGLIPGAGGCVSLSRRIGWRRTALLVLSGRRINARVALDWGLIDEII